MAIDRTKAIPSSPRRRSCGPEGLADRQGHSLLVLADLIGGVAELRAGDVKSAASRLASLKSRYDKDDRVESNWVAALAGEVSLAEGRPDQALSSFKAAQSNAWFPLGRDASTVFVANLPSRDGLARIEVARGNRRAAIAEYRRLTSVGTGFRSSAVLEPRHVLELARLLAADGDDNGARAEFRRFLKFWASADAGLPEVGEAKKSADGSPEID